MQKLSSEGRYEINTEMLGKLQSGFAAGCCDDDSSIETIGKVFRDHSYLMDPHTAVAWNVCSSFMESFGPEPVVVLSTASPYKFPAACLRALGEQPENDEFAVMRRLNEISGVPVPKNLAGLESAEVLHTDVISKEDMLGYVLAYLAE